MAPAFTETLCPSPLSSLEIMEYTVFIVQAYQISQYVVPRGGIFLGKWRSSFAGSSDRKMNVQSACALNTRYYLKAERDCYLHRCSQFIAGKHCSHATSRNMRI
jgi:hypothetical protein